MKLNVLVELVVAAALPLLLASEASSAVQYQVTDLGTLGGSSSYAYGVNASGTVVGVSNLSGNSTSHAFSYSGGVMHDLSTLGGAGSIAYGINSVGVIAGNSAANGGQNHAFSYSGGVMNDLGVLYINSSSFAQGINNNGTIVGYAYGPNHNWYHAFSDDAGVMTDIGTLGGSNSAAYAISNTGIIVGISDQAPIYGGQHAFSYSNGTWHDLGDLGNLGTRNPFPSVAYGVNDSGTVVGQSEAAGNAYRAFVYSDGSMHDLGTLGGTGSIAYGINTAGDIVGAASTTGDASSHAFIDSGGTLIDLEPYLAGIGLTSFSEARAIDDNGDIVGEGVLPNGNYHAFLLTPVPEPSSLALMGVAAIALFRGRDRGN